MNNSVDFDQYTDNYNDLLKENTQFFSPNEEYFAKYKVEVVKNKTQNRIENILEYGCGIGRNMPFLSNAFPHAHILGSDISAASIEMAKKENPGINFFCEGTDPLPNTKFDLIFIAGVFHHIPPKQRDEVLKNLSNRLSSDGTVFIFEHNPYNPITRRIVNSCPYDADAVLLKPSELKERLVRAQYSIVANGYCLFIPPRFKQLTKLESCLGWLPLGGQYWIQARYTK